MNVLSLFDGISCGHVALERAGIFPARYYASEINKDSIAVAQDNYPDTIQLGDVRGVKGRELPVIDLLIGGSPCQDFSSANWNRAGLEGDKSGLFYEYLRLLKETKESRPGNRRRVDSRCNRSHLQGTSERQRFRADKYKRDTGSNRNPIKENDQANQSKGRHS